MSEEKVVKRPAKKQMSRKRFVSSAQTVWTNWIIKMLQSCASSSRRRARLFPEE